MAGLDLRSSGIKEIQTMLDMCHADLREIAKLYPEVIDQLEFQMKMDESMYGRIPTYVRVSTNEGLVNTTIKYSEFKKFLQVWKQRPDLIDSKMVENILHPTKIPLLRDSDSAEDRMGTIPDALFKKR